MLQYYNRSDVWKLVKSYLRFSVKVTQKGHFDLVLIFFYSVSPFAKGGGGNTYDLGMETLSSATGSQRVESSGLHASLPRTRSSPSMRLMGPSCPICALTAISLPALSPVTLSSSVSDEKNQF